MSAEASVRAAGRRLVLEEDVFLREMKKLSVALKRKTKVSKSDAEEALVSIGVAAEYLQTLKGEIEEALQHLGRGSQASSSSSSGAAAAAAAADGRPGKRSRSGDAADGAGLPTIRRDMLKHLGRAPRKGDLVAAFVRAQENWILAQVLNYNIHSGTVEVADADDAGGASSHGPVAGERHRHVLQSEHCVTLPRPSECFGGAYPPGAKVFAMFPQSTCFYPCVVAQKASRRGRKESCFLYFHDDEEELENGMKVVPVREVPSRFVTLIPPGAEHA